MFETQYLNKVIKRIKIKKVKKTNTDTMDDGKTSKIKIFKNKISDKKFLVP